MQRILPVKFIHSSRELWFNPGDVEVVAGDHVICTTARGIEIGVALRDVFEVSEEHLQDVLGESELQSVIKVADQEDFEFADELAKKSEEAFPVFRRIAKESGLEMKPVALEYIFGGDKIVCYFAAEDRVDFRQLVRDLAHELHERIDMRQIGVREEAALMGGFAHCGQELCCARLGAQFEPVTIRMAKDQDLLLNSAKISGACGRLMCCLRYELDAYQDFKDRAPKRNALIDTPLGKAKVVEFNTPKEEVCLRLENGKQMRISLSDMTCSGFNHECCKEHGEKNCSACGCTAKPDTVKRDVLERLNSPEIQMALAELDRQNGIDTGYRISEEDRIELNDKPATRRKHPEKNDVQKDETTRSSRKKKSQAKQSNTQREEEVQKPHPLNASPLTLRPRKRRSTQDTPAEDATPLPKAKRVRVTSNTTSSRIARRPGDKGKPQQSEASGEPQKKPVQRRIRKPKITE